MSALVLARRGANETVARVPPPSHLPPPRVTRDSPLHVVVPGRAGADMARLGEELARHPDLRPGQLHWHKVARTQALEVTARRAAQAAREDGGVLIACGGDGTVNTVAQRAWAEGLPFSVLPHGTFNYFSRAHGLGRDPHEGLQAVLDALAAGACQPVELGQIEDRLFLVNASLGLYPRVLNDREAANRRFGRRRLVALLASVGTLLSPDQGQTLRLRMRQADGREHETVQRLSTLFVGNNALQLAQLGVRPDGVDAEGRTTVMSHPLTALMFGPQPRRHVLRLLLMALLRRLPQDPAVDILDFEHLEVDTGRGGRFGRPAHLRVAFDGETRWMRLPLRIARAPQPLWLVAPPPASVGPTTG